VGRKQRHPNVSPSEWAIIKALWDGGSMAVGDLYARLQAEHRWAYSTVKTLVRRLVRKGWITYRRVGNSFLYEPAVSRSEAVHSEIKRFSDRVLDGLLSPFVAYYAERGDLTDDDVAELERILEQYREERGQEP
jgi:BlaI family penicillinase repressor